MRFFFVFTLVTFEKLKNLKAIAYNYNLRDYVRRVHTYTCTDNRKDVLSAATTTAPRRGAAFTMKVEEEIDTGSMNK